MRRKTAKPQSRVVIQKRLPLQQACERSAATMASFTTAEKLHAASRLPPKLLTFFKKYPPPALLRNPPQGAASRSHDYRVLPVSPKKTNYPSPTTAAAATDSPVNTSSKDPSQNTANYRNPFLPWLNPETGKWHNPKYSLRQQADLFKLAAQTGLSEFLPFSTKAPEYRQARKELFGELRMKGTGEGDQVKGKKWERQLKGKLETRRQAMVDMPRLIAEWKQRGHGRGWKKVSVSFSATLFSSSCISSVPLLQF